jgi:hypothetical protein
MKRKEKIQFENYLTSLGMIRSDMREWHFPDDIIHWNYYLVYERDNTFKVYMKSTPKKFEDEYRIITTDWINFTCDFENFKIYVNSAVDNYKNAIRQIKELKAQEDF